MQHVNYYYDTVAIQIEQFKQSEIEFYKNRYGLEEKVEKESVNYVDEETKECYNFVDSSLTRFYDANKRKPSTQSEGPSMQ
jgi:hypothetical protein